MSMEVKGKLIQKMAVVTGQGQKGKWEKQEFVIETDDQFPKKVCMSVWGDKLSMLEKLTEGDRITVSVNLESREYNSRWYTDVRAWRIERNSDEGVAPSSIDDMPLAPEDIGNDLPF